MHDRRTHVQFCEIADNLFRIDNSLTAIASFATGPCAQHIGFTDDHTVRQFHTLLYRANANAVTVTDKMLCKTINVPGFDVMLTQELVENLASAGRFGHKKHAFIVSLNILLQQMCGCFSLGVNPQVWQGLGRKRALMLWVFAAKHDALACAEALIEFVCTQVELLRR